MGDLLSAGSNAGFMPKENRKNTADSRGKRKTKETESGAAVAER